MTNEPVELGIEQQFALRSFEVNVAQMSREQAQDFLVNLYKQMMVREALYHHLLKHQWQIEDPTYRL